MIASGNIENSDETKIAIPLKISGDLSKCTIHSPLTNIGTKRFMITFYISFKLILNQK